MNLSPSFLERPFPKRCSLHYEAVPGLNRIICLLFSKVSFGLRRIAWRLHD